MIYANGLDTGAIQSALEQLRTQCIRHGLTPGQEEAMLSVCEAALVVADPFSPLANHGRAIQRLTNTLVGLRAAVVNAEIEANE